MKKSTDIRVIKTQKALLCALDELIKTKKLSNITITELCTKANINRNTLLADMHAFKDVMASGAYLVLSGFYEDDIPMLVNKASELGLEYHSKRTSGEWRCLVFR